MKLSSVKQEMYLKHNGPKGPIVAFYKLHKPGIIVMPYSKSNPPDVIKKLSKDKQDQWIAVWNSCHKRGLSEEACFKTAWGVVKKASCECPSCNGTPGQIIGPAISEGALADNTLNKDILDAKASQELVAISQEIRPFNGTIARVLSDTSCEL